MILNTQKYQKQYFKCLTYLTHCAFFKNMFILLFTNWRITTGICYLSSLSLLPKIITSSLHQVSIKYMEGYYPSVPHRTSSYGYICKTINWNLVIFEHEAYSVFTFGLGSGRSLEAEILLRSDLFLMLDIMFFPTTVLIMQDFIRTVVTNIDPF